MLSEDYEKKMASLLTSYVDIGINEKSADYVYKSGKNLAMVASAMEFGTSKIPSRSFIRLPFLIKKKQIRKYEAILLKNVLKRDNKTTLNLLGEFGKNVVLGAFDTGGYGYWAPLSPVTIELKGSSTILINTGTLRSSIDYQISMTGK